MGQLSIRGHGGIISRRYWDFVGAEGEGSLTFQDVNRFLIRVMGVQWNRVLSCCDPEIAATQLDTTRGTPEAFHRMMEFVCDGNFFFLNFTDVDHVLVPCHGVPPHLFTENIL